MRRQHGFTLVELMVGVTISLVGLLAVSSMMLTFSKKRNSITQTMATQDNGVMALYRIERDLAQAGYGLMDLQGCASLTDATVSPSVARTVLPVRIVDNGGTASDDIIVQYGGAGSGSGVPGATLTSMTSTNRYNVQSSVGFEVGELVAASTDCTLRAVSSTGTGTVDYTPAGTPNSTEGILANLGNQFVSRRYQVASNALTVSELGATANNLVDDIVYLKAEYGLANSNTGTTVTSWVGGTTAITNANSARVIAVRVGVVARSPLAEGSSEVERASNTLTVLPAITDSGGTTIGAAATFAMDARYRYRAYYTIVPLRNVIWTRS